MRNLIKVYMTVLVLITSLGAEFLRVDNKDIVIDTSTNLMWQDNIDANTTSKSWIDAIKYCESLSLGGYNDWRLPNVNELESIIDYNSSNPAISNIFKYVASEFYWSSTSAYNYNNNAIDIFFDDGENSEDDKQDAENFRCVRDINN
jgi:hypothetical protein